MGYQTEQRKLLCDFFRAHPHERFSTKDIVAALPKGTISMSAIYRNLTAMAEDGTVDRSFRAGEREACYQYLQADECANAIHLVCTKCGKICHLSGKLQNTLAGLVKEDGFRISTSKTMLYGVCKNCL